jgi:hypothetical protein
MSEPSSNVPDVDSEADSKVDPEKLEAWNAVKADYQVEPHGQPVANSMDGASTAESDRPSDGDEPPDSADDADNPAHNEEPPD